VIQSHGTHINPGTILGIYHHNHRRSLRLYPVEKEPNFQRNDQILLQNKKTIL